MTTLKVLVIPASLQYEAPDARLVSAVTRELIALDAEVTRISLADFPLPIYDASLDDEPGAFKMAGNLGRMIAVHHGVFIAAPEYNASLPPRLKNTIDWIACLSGRKGLPTPFRDRAFAIGSASDDTKGGEHCLTALRQILTLGCGATVIPSQISVTLARQAFDETDRLREWHDIEQLRASVKQLVDFSERMR